MTTRDIGTRWLYTGVAWRISGEVGGVRELTEYALVQPCEIIEVGASANFPTVTRYVVRLANGSERYCYDAHLTPIEVAAANEDKEGV